MNRKERTFEATLARLDMGKATRWQLQKYLARKNRASIYQIHKELGWTVGKTQAGLKRLEKLGVVESNKEPCGDRICNFFSLAPAESLLKK
jgi:DNA-binding MarR family transcriptional regulator